MGAILCFALGALVTPPPLLMIFSNKWGGGSSIVPVGEKTLPLFFLKIKKEEGGVPSAKHKISSKDAFIVDNKFLYTLTLPQKKDD